MPALPREVPGREEPGPPPPGSRWGRPRDRCPGQDHRDGGQSRRGPEQGGPGRRGEGPARLAVLSARVGPPGLTLAEREEARQDAPSRGHRPAPRWTRPGLWVRLVRL